MRDDDLMFPDAPRSWRRELAETFELAWPLVLTQLAQMAIYSTDVLMIGRLGATELAASALAVNLYSVFLFTGQGLVTAAAPLVAAELGARRHSVREVRRSWRDLAGAAQLTSAAEVNDLLARLRERLLEELDGQTTLIIE